MKANLQAGQLIPPRSLGQVYKRLKQLKHEMERIDQQLNDNLHPLRPENTSRYDEWRRRATGTKQRFEREELLLRNWLVLYLLKEVQKFLKGLREDEFEFTAEELDMIQRIDDYLTKEIP